MLGRLADDLWGSVDGIVPAGSAGNVIGGVLRLSAALLYGSAYLFWGFGSHGHA